MSTNVQDRSIVSPELSEGAGGGSPPALDPNVRALRDSSPEPARTGIWVGLAAISMMFAAFTSALVVRQGTAFDWLHIRLPLVIYLNTFVLLLSSVTLEVSRRRIGEYLHGSTNRIVPLRWLSATLFLALIFVVGQVIAWQQLRSMGLYLATSPASSFFYVLTAMHALHVLGGIGGLLRVTRKLAETVPSLSRSTFSATACYWHFMGALWIYLLVIIHTQL